MWKAVCRRITSWVNRSPTTRCSSKGMMSLTILLVNDRTADGNQFVRVRIPYSIQNGNIVAVVRMRDIMLTAIREL